MTVKGTDMLDKGIIGLIQSYGPSMAGWVLLFVSLAWIAGKGGKLAMSNIKSLLDQSEELRKNIGLQLSNCARELEARDSTIRQLRQDMDTAQITLRRMTRELTEMSMDMERVRIELQNARTQLRVRRPGNEA